MAFDAYLWIDGVEGESTAKVEGLKNHMEILSFSFGASNPSTIGPGSSGAGGGRVSVSSFNVMKMSEKASAKLFEHCCMGEHFTKAKVVLRKAGGTGGAQAPFLEYEFEKVFVDSIQWSGSGGGDDRPTESISFAFAKVTITYYVQDAKGKPAKGPQAFWDLTTVSKG